MKTHRFFTALLIGSSCVSICSTALADTFGADFKAKGGLEYDSNLNVTELDRVTEASDTARVLDARLSGDFEPTDKLSFKASYGYSEKDYRDHDGFDQIIQTLSGDASYDFSLLTLGTSYHLADAELGSDPFLELTQRSLYAGKLVDGNIYLRAAANRKQKTFDNNPNRNAEADGVDADLFVFFNGANRFISFGLIREDEDARADVFDHKAYGFRGRFSNRFVLLGKDSRVQLAWRHMRRDYANVDPQIGDRRQDIRRTAEASWQLDLTSFLSAIGKLEYGNHESNLASADYDEALASIMLQATF
ncbi:MAG: hypothetical protein WDZ30_12940 [Cellvibrionaceae bacterium]